MSRRTAGRAKGGLRDFKAALERRGGPSPAGQDSESRYAELASVRAKLREKNAEAAKLTTLACRVALLSEENEQLRRSAGGGRVVGLPGGSGQ